MQNIHKTFECATKTVFAGLLNPVTRITMTVRHADCTGFWHIDDVTNAARQLAFGEFADMDDPAEIVEHIRQAIEADPYQSQRVKTILT